MSHEQRLNEIRHRAEKATSGPWFLMLDGFSRKPPHNSPTVYAADSELRYIAWFRDVLCTTPTPDADNAEFVAHSREDIPYLLDRVAELERLVGEYREAQAALMLSSITGKGAKEAWNGKYDAECALFAAVPEK